jgi:CheY-like chemotaxis protein
VVDDEAGVRKILRRLIDEDGYYIHEAGDGAQALELVRAAPDLLDLVVSDIVMPRLDGVQPVQAFATETPELPCLLIPGTCRQSWRASASPRRAGCS